MEEIKRNPKSIRLWGQAKAQLIIHMESIITMTSNRCLNSVERANLVLTRLFQEISNLTSI